MIIYLLKQKKVELWEDVFDNLFTNSTVYEDKNGYTIRSTSSRFTFQYTGTQINIKGVTQTGPTNNYLHVFVNDVYLQSVQIVNDIYNTILLPKGNKIVSILSGQTSRSDFNLPINGTFLTGVEVNTLEYSKLNIQNNNTEFVFLGDSITVGANASTNINGYANLFYNDDKLSTTIIGWGWAQLHNFASDTAKINDTVARIVTALNNAPNKKLIIALGTNDYGIAARPVVDFIGYARNLINAIVLADSTIDIWWNEPLFRENETALLQSYRDSLVSLSIELGTFVVIPCRNCAVYPSDYSDSVHPNNHGHKKYKDFVATYINL